MKTAVIYLALLVGQMHTLQDGPVIHLRPDQDFIKNEYGGATVELANSQKVIQLPKQPPTVDSRGKPWAVDIKNAGPNSVTVVGRADFSVLVPVGKVVHIKFTSTGFSSSQ
jgi:hypothetical protein